MESYLGMDCVGSTETIAGTHQGYDLLGYFAGGACITTAVCSCIHRWPVRNDASLPLWRVIWKNLFIWLLSWVFKFISFFSSLPYYFLGRVQVWLFIFLLLVQMLVCIRSYSAGLAIFICFHFHLFCSTKLFNCREWFSGSCCVEILFRLVFCNWVWVICINFIFVMERLWIICSLSSALSGVHETEIDEVFPTRILWDRETVSHKCGRYPFSIFHIIF